MTSNGKIIINVDKLLSAVDASAMDLVRSGISPTTAYRLINNVGGGITFDVLAILCNFFSAKMHRPVSVGEILIYEPEPDKKD